MTCSRTRIFRASWDMRLLEIRGAQHTSDSEGPPSAWSLLVALYDGIFSTFVDPVWREIFQKCSIRSQQLAVPDFNERHLHWAAQLVYARLRANAAQRF